ncbi:MAG: hypothetical protein ABFS41_07165 [Myxococcota bacterium]
MKDCATTRRGVSIGLALLLGIAAATRAEARDLTVRWRYAAPERVAGFRLHLGPEPGRYTRTVDVGKPNADAEGVFRVRIEVPDDEATFVAVTAYDGRGTESPFSNETVRAAAPERAATGHPPGLGTPGRPQLVSP